MAELSFKSDGSFGNLAVITWAGATMHVTMDYGPRIIYFGLNGEKNILYTDGKKTPDGDAFPLYGGQRRILYGGHRLCAYADNKQVIYYPDNTPVHFSEAQGFLFQAAVENHTGLQKSLLIHTLDGGGFSIEHRIKNCGLWDIEVSPWCSTMVLPDTECLLLPGRTGESGNFFAPPGFSIHFWQGGLYREEITFLKDRIKVQNLKSPEAVHFSFNNDRGIFACHEGRQLFTRQYPSYANGLYPHEKCSASVYLTKDYTELSSHGEVTLLLPEDELSFTEYWQIRLSERHWEKVVLAMAPVPLESL